MPRQTLTVAIALTAMALATAARAGHAMQTPRLAPPAPTARPLPPGALRVQRTEIIDRQGFEKPLVAATLLIPVGWRTEGGIEWASNPCDAEHRFNWKATAPDNSAVIQILPEEKWAAGNFPQPDNPCRPMRLSGNRAYLEWFVQRNRPGARVLDYRPRPDLVETLKGLVIDDRQGGGEFRSWVEAGDLLIGYQVGGRSMREVIGDVTVFTFTRLPGMDPSQSIDLLRGESFPGFAYRAPEGQLDFKTSEALRKSIQLGPEWNARIRRTQDERHRIAMESGRQMAETNRRAAADRSAIIAQTSREINEIQMGTWQSTNLSTDRTQRESIEAVRGVETYNDPHYGGSVQLSNQYQHAWQLRDGSYLLTDDSNFDPSRDLGVQGQRLQRTQ